MASQEHSPQNTKPEVLRRPLADFPPTVWGDSFASFSLANLELESYAKEIEVLKERVKEMLMDSTSDPVEKISLVNSLCRLGVSYHFESEIEEQLKQIFGAQLNLVGDGDDHDLCTVALVFRVFRQHGYKITCDVFNKFKDSDGKFKEMIVSDARGMLSLYEATHLRMHGEDTLEEALAFTMAHLKSLATQSSPHLAKHIMNAMDRPFHKGIPRLEARQHISFYEEDDSRNETLLKFTKLDFNLLQSLHQQELSQISRWYKDLGIASELSYARDRIVEIYFWTVGAYFEPQYMHARIMLSKIITMMTFLDDTYDAYGTIEELDRFTDAVKRWDSNALDHLPEYMKVLYKAMLNLYDDLENELAKEGRSYSVHYARDELKEMVRGYHVEAQWFSKGYVPSIEEYVGNGLITSCYHAITAASFIGMGEIAGTEAFEWLQNKPKILKAAETIGRLMDDIVSNETEQKRGHVVSGIECYMKQYRVSKEEAVEEFNRMVANAWKDINEEYTRPTSVSMHLLMRVVNLSRVIDVIYKHDDGYTNSENLKEYIISLFVDQIPI